MSLPIETQTQFLWLVFCSDVSAKPAGDIRTKSTGYNYPNPDVDTRSNSFFTWL